MFSALLNLLYIVPTLYMLQVYDRVVPTEGKLTLFFLTLVLLFGLGTLVLLDVVRSRLLVRASIRLDREMAPAILTAMLDEHRAPDTRQALRDFDMLRQALTGPVMMALFDAPWAPIYVLVCFLVHPLIGLLAVVGAGLGALIGWRNERAVKTRLQEAATAASIAYAAQEQSLSQGSTIRALGMRDALVARQLEQRVAMMRQQTRASFVAGGYTAAGKFVRLSLQSLALGLGALLAIKHGISAGAIFASSFLIARALTPMEQLVGSWRTIVLARGAFDNLSKVLDRRAASAPPTRLPDPTGAVRLENVNLTAPHGDRPILRDVRLDIAAGDSIAIIGPSGAGKSSLVRLIAGADVPTTGTIRFDGADRADWVAEDLARHIGYLPQEPALLAGTVKENISRFRGALERDPGAVDQAVVKAAQGAGAHEMILQLPGGYDYRLGPGGAGLSAGQSQRVALARALFGEPVLLILDEPNAHLDGDGDVQLLETIALLKRAAATVLIVSHKRSVLPAVDKLIVLRNGAIQLFGPRDDVLRQLGGQRAPASATSAGARPA